MKLAVALLVLAGCGEVTRLISDAPGAPGDGDEQVLVTTSPSDGEVTVDVLRPIVLTFSRGGASPAVHVFERESKRELETTATWDDAAHTLTVVPARPTSYGMQYRVETAGYATFRFRTYIGQALSSISYDAQGEAISSEMTTLDPEGFADVTSAFGRGVLVATDDQTYRSDGELVHRVVRDTMDQITAWQAMETSTSGITTVATYNGAGPDGTWMTADDRLSAIATTEYDDRDRIARQTAKNGTGTIISTTSFAYAGNDTAATTASAAGPDGVWATLDDTISRVQRTTRDASGRLVESRTFDGTNKQVGRTVYTYDPVTLLESSHATWEAGPDNVWNTSDDRPRTLFETAYDSAHRRTRYDTHDVGADGIAHTADDRLLTTFAFGSPL